MKQILLLILLSSMCFSCGKENTKENLYPDKKLSPEEQLLSDGKSLFDSNKAACVSCHHINKKTVGPSITEIAKT